jgi:O-antigen/teichoic acid export membrane protein
MFIFSILFLSLGWGIGGLAIASTISALITMAVYILICAKVAPYLKLNPFLLSFEVISEAKKFIIYGAIGGITSMAQFQLNKMIITYFLGLKYLTYYDLGHKLVSAMFGLLCSFISPIMPAASGVHASLGLRKLKGLFETTLKYLTLMAAPIFLFTAVFANNIIFVWLGVGYEETAFVLRFISISYLILILTGPGASILTGIGQLEVPFYGSVLTAVTNATLSLILVTNLGLTGIIISDISANSLCTLFGFYFFQKKLGSNILDISKAIKFPFITSIGILFILSFIVGYIGNHYIELFLAAIFFSVTYVLLAYRNPAYERLQDFIRKPFFFFTYRG